MGAPMEFKCHRPEGGASWRKRPSISSTRGLLLSCFLMVIANLFSIIHGPWFPHTHIELHKQNPTLLSPHCSTTALWCVVCVLQVCTAVVEITEALPGGRHARRRGYLALAYLMNAFWLGVFANELFTVSTFVMATYTVVLFRAYLDLDIKMPWSSSRQRHSPLICRAALGMNLALALVTTCQEVFLMKGHLDGELTQGWHEVTGNKVEVSVTLVTLCLFVLTAVTSRFDWAFAFTVAWALHGMRITQHQLGASEEANLTFWAEMLCLLSYALALHWTVQRKVRKAPRIRLVRSNSRAEEDWDSDKP